MRNVSKSQMHWVWSVRHRLFASVLFAIAAAVFLPPHYFLLTRMLCIWNAGAVSFLLLTWMLMLQGTPELMRHHAQQLDAGRLTILSTIVAAACASLLAIVFLLRDTKGLPPNLLLLHLGLSVLTIVGSWMQVHTIFTMHYAHGYYGNRSKQHGSYSQAGGLDFPGDDEPDYKDFLYFSFGIGMTCFRCRRADYFSFHEISGAFSQRALVLFQHRYFGYECQYYCGIEWIGFSSRCCIFL